MVSGGREGGSGEWKGEGEGILVSVALDIDFCGYRGLAALHFC